MQNYGTRGEIHKVNNDWRENLPSQCRLSLRPLLSRLEGGAVSGSCSRNSVSLAPVSSRPTSSSAILKCSAVFSRDLKPSARSCPGAPCGGPGGHGDVRNIQILKRYITEHSTSIHTCTHTRTHAHTLYVYTHIIIYSNSYNTLSRAYVF